MTVSAFTSVSLQPPLVLVCVVRDANMHEVIPESGVFAVSVLGAAETTRSSSARCKTLGAARPRLRCSSIMGASTGSSWMPLSTGRPSAGHGAGRERCPEAVLLRHAGRYEQAWPASSRSMTIAAEMARSIATPWAEWSVIQRPDTAAIPGRPNVQGGLKSGRHQ